MTLCGSYRTLSQFKFTLIIHIQSPRGDLIALDSPFISDPSESLATSQDDTSDFENVWKALENNNARGWCEVATDVVVRRLQGLRLDMKVIPIDRPPFEGQIVASTGCCFLMLTYI
jgi:AP-4 complex subunit epsilon-1